MEWLETDGLGGFAMGSAIGMPMRRYHALLNTAVGNPANRVCLLNAVEAWITINSKRYALSSFSFGAENIHPNGLQYLKSFNILPIPTWTFNCDGVEVIHEIFMLKDSPAICLSWRVEKSAASLEVRPFISGRSYHALHKENHQINLNAEETKSYIRFNPYSNLPALYAFSSGIYGRNDLWFKNINYDEDRKRGADYTEDWASPGIFKFELDSKKNSEATIIFSAEDLNLKETVEKAYAKFKKLELKRRDKFSSALSKAADAYIVKRGSGKTIIAGYPWFADWGRDTFISMRGLCLANDRLEDAKSILTEWSKTILDGMIPNRFVEAGEEPEYNSVDASLWFIISCFEYIKLDKRAANFFKPAISAVIEGFIAGTRYNIGLDTSDGLLRAGVKGAQLTWMDAKIGDYVVTPRIGKPVEIQALWLNALKISTLILDKHADIYNLGLNSFRAKFWNHDLQCLYDVIDVDHNKGELDASVRPNQLFAVGGLPFSIIEDTKAKLIMNKVESDLYTQHAIRTLSPHDSRYRGHYTGDGFSRDSAYHQGTAWPWLMGAFIEGWVRSRGSTKKAKKEAYDKFFVAFIKNLDNSGLGHLSEIHDADGPFNSRGCPFQAWSVAEALRLEKDILA